MLVLKDMKFSVEGDNLRVLIEKDRKAEASLSGFSAFRFTGACFSSGYKIDGFEKERIGKTLVEPDKIRVYREENGKPDRVFEKFTQDEFITIATYIQKNLNTNELVFSLRDKEGKFDYSVNVSPDKIAVFDNQTMNMKAINLNPFFIFRIKAVIELAVLGLLPSPVFIRGTENNISIGEAVVPEKELTEQHEQNIKKIIDVSKKQGLNQYALIRQYYKQQKIPYTRKVIFQIGKKNNKIKVHLPVSYAFAVKIFFETCN
ncbi:MAG: hypothetical protein GXO21_04290 [Aquificae bacterium]|nr:hypothetical protein [Aquificota bacterium]